MLFLLFKFPYKIPLTNSFHSCIDYTVDDERFFYTDKIKHYDEIRDGVVSFETIYQWRRKYVRENKKGVCPTLTANMGTGGHNVPLILTDKGIRKLTPKECLNFQGFPKDYDFPKNLSLSAMYKQAGNSVVIPLLEQIGKEIADVINN